MALEAVEKLHELSVKSVKVYAYGQDTCAVCLQVKFVIYILISTDKSKSLCAFYLGALLNV